MILIWRFHIEYLQPAGFYLKAPTLLYVFIFIALRALRFDVTFLLLTGLSAALGWMYLVYFAASFDSLESPITRSYVEYMTSNKVLRGAEFDRSEEHTSELQSLMRISYAVFCLKKKKL